MAAPGTDPDLDDAHPLFLALEADGGGAHPAAAGRAGRSAAALGPGPLRDVLAAAQDAGFVLVTFQDGPLPTGPAADPVGRVEAGTRAAYAAVLTDRLGLAPTLHAALVEPFHLATQLATLDHAAHGRAAWVVGGANSPEERATIGALPLAPDALRREALDVVDTARALWDSWEDDAVIKDQTTGRYLDSAKVHHIGFEGASFTVKGPLITPRPPQGQVVVLAPDELEIDERADIVLISRPGLAAIGERARQARQAGAPLAFATVEFALDEGPDTSAAERLVRLDAAGPWPDSGALRYVGPASGLVDLLRGLAEIVDGVRLVAADLSVDLPILTGQVLPALAAAGVRRVAPRAEDTLRTTLGLPRPTNRFALAAAPTSSRSAI